MEENPLRHDISPPKVNSISPCAWCLWNFFLIASIVATVMGTVCYFEKVDGVRAGLLVCPGEQAAHNTLGLILIIFGSIVLMWLLFIARCGKYCA